MCSRKKAANSNRALYPYLVQIHTNCSTSYDNTLLCFWSCYNVACLFLLLLPRNQMVSPYYNFISTVCIFANIFPSPLFDKSNPPNIFGFEQLLTFEQRPGSSYIWLHFIPHVRLELRKGNEKIHCKLKSKMNEGKLPGRDRCF